MERLEQLGLAGRAPWPLAATSEDLALLLAWERGADLIVAVGTHANLVEYLDKGRKGMASRSSCASRWAPARGREGREQALPRVGGAGAPAADRARGAVVVVTAVILISPAARAFFELVILRVRAWLGY